MAGMNSAAGPLTVNSEQSIAIVDAGLCSKVQTQLPQLMTFFLQTKNALAAISKRDQANSAATANLQRTQVDFNNQTNFWSFWFRQVSSGMDATGVSLTRTNDALTDMITMDPSKADPPGVPSGIALFPGPDAYGATFYFVPPSYVGSTPLNADGYEIQIFDSIANALAGTPVSTVVTVEEGPMLYSEMTSAVINPVTANEFYSLYGTQLMVCRMKTTEASVAQSFTVRVRASNSSGMNGNRLYGQWSAPSVLVRTSDNLPAPVVTSVLSGVNKTLVSWQSPYVEQADGSHTKWAGITSWKVNDVLVVGSNSAIAEITTSLLSNASSVSIIGYSDIVATKAVTTASSPHAFVSHSIIPSPRITVRMSGLYAYITCKILNYYEPGVITYSITTFDKTANAAGPTSIATTTLGATSNVVQGVITSGLIDGHMYTFSATAQVIGFGQASEPSATVGPIMAGTSITPPTEPATFVLTGSNPSNEAEFIDFNITKLTATFNQPPGPVTSTNMKASPFDASVTQLVSVDGNTASITLSDGAMLPATTYTVNVSGIGASPGNTNPLVNKSWTFTTNGSMEFVEHDSSTFSLSNRNVATFNFTNARGGAFTIDAANIVDEIMWRYTDVDPLASLQSDLHNIVAPNDGQSVSFTSNSWQPGEIDIHVFAGVDGLRATNGEFIPIINGTTDYYVHAVVPFIVLDQTPVNEQRDFHPGSSSIMFRLNDVPNGTVTADDFIIYPALGNQSAPVVGSISVNDKTVTFQPSSWLWMMTRYNVLASVQSSRKSDLNLNLSWSFVTADIVTTWSMTPMYSGVAPTTLTTQVNDLKTELIMGFAYFSNSTQTNMILSLDPNYLMNCVTLISKTSNNVYQPVYDLYETPYVASHRFRLNLTSLPAGLYNLSIVTPFPSTPFMNSANGALQYISGTYLQSIQIPFNIKSVLPTNSATSVAYNASISVECNGIPKEDYFRVYDTNYDAENGGVPTYLEGSVSVTGNIITFTPTNSFSSFTNYEVSVQLRQGVEYPTVPISRIWAFTSGQGPFFFTQTIPSQIGPGQPGTISPPDGMTPVRIEVTYNEFPVYPLDAFIYEDLGNADDIVNFRRDPEETVVAEKTIICDFNQWSVTSGNYIAVIQTRADSSDFGNEVITTSWPFIIEIVMMG